MDSDDDEYVFEGNNEGQQDADEGHGLELVNRDDFPGFGSSKVWDAYGWCNKWKHGDVTLDYVWIFEGLQRIKKGSEWDDVVVPGDLIVVQEKANSTPRTLKVCVCVCMCVYMCVCVFVCALAEVCMCV